jgi:hypothetical protein
MWCIGVLNADYRGRMYDLLELYARPYCEHEPVVCIDEKSKQLLKDARSGLSIQPGVPPRMTMSTFALAPATCSWRSSPRASAASCA